MEAGEYSLPAQPQAAKMKKFACLQRLSNRVHGGAQKRKPRPREIQTSKPPAQGGGISQPLGIFDSGRRSFPATTFHKVAPKRLATGDQAVVAIGQREGRQKGERLPAHIAVAAPNRNPVMVFVVSLFAPAAVTDDGIAQTNRALTKDRPASFDPVGFEVVLGGGK
jgi:hypothetical protein